MKIRLIIDWNLPRISLTGVIMTGILFFLVTSQNYSAKNLGNYSLERKMSKNGIINFKL